MSKETARLFRQIALERGQMAEQRVEYALNKALTDPSIITPNWLLGHQSATETEDKREKTDRWVVTDVGRIRLQIKSSKKSAERFHEDHPNIPVVFVRAGESDCTVLQRIFFVVGQQRELYLEKRNGRQEESLSFS